MRKRIWIAIVAFVSCLMIPSNVAKASFYDVSPTDWFYEYVCYVEENEIMTGTVKGEIFSPYGILSRAEVVTILYNMAGRPPVEYEQIFVDVTGEEWYASALIWAYQNQYATGYTDTQEFRPLQYVTREEYATFLHRYSGLEEAVGNVYWYPDGMLVQEWAKESMNWAVGRGIIRGINGYLVPYGQTSRAECATMVTRFVRGDEAPEPPNTLYFANPCPEAVITSEFGPREAPTAGASSDHKGRDYGAPTGTPIYAVTDGVVIKVADSAIRGNYVDVYHGLNAEGKALVSRYQHCSEILVTQGQTVKMNEMIAKVGATGLVTGPHLHFEILEDDEPVDPRKYVPQ